MKPSDDPYTLLGLHRGASLEEVKRAYRRLAMRWHPDRNLTSEAEGEFKRIKAAYELILDPERYAQWLATDASSPPPDDEDEDGPEPPGADLTQTLILSLEEAARGCVKSVELSRSSRCGPCHGSGRVRHNHSVPCPQCNATGRIRGEGWQSRKCEGCGGRGYLRETECEACAGSGWRKKQRTLSVKVPPGTIQGERLRLARQAHHSPDGEKASGDLYLEIRLAKHSLFEMEGRDLHCTVPVSIFRLLGGGKMDVPTLSGSTVLDLQPFPGHGLDYRIHGQGFPKKRGGAGDLVVHLEPVYPQNLSEKERALLDKLDQALHQNPAQSAPELAAWEARMRERQTG